MIPTNEWYQSRYDELRKEYPDFHPLTVEMILSDEIHDLHQEERKKAMRRNTTFSKDVNKYFITLTATASAKEYATAILKILKQKRIQITYGYGCIELTKDGKPHAHIYLECKRYISKSDITRIWKRSYVDLKNVKKDNGIRNYQDKDADNAPLLAYLDAVGIQRVYHL